MNWVIPVVGWIIFRRFEWYVRLDSGTLAVMLGTGLCIGIEVEWVAVVLLDRWTYAANIPLLPTLNAGLVPVLHILLPPLVFHIARRWARKDFVAASKGHRDSRVSIFSRK